MHPHITLDGSRLKLGEEIFSFLLGNAENWDIAVIGCTESTGKFTGDIVVDNGTGSLSFSSEDSLLAETAVTTLDEGEFAFNTLIVFL